MTSSATKSAIVTGASGGIGGSIAKRLAKDGVSVVVNYAGRPASEQAVVEDIKAAGGQGIAVQADVAIVLDVERLFKESIDTFGRPNVVVHCAGIKSNRHICLHSDALSPRSLDICDNCLCWGRFSSVVHDYRNSIFSQSFCDRASDSTRGAGDNRALRC